MNRFTEPGLLEQWFQSRYGRPAPWFELATTEDVADLASVLARRLKLASSGDLARVLSSVPLPPRRLRTNRGDRASPRQVTDAFKANGPALDGDVLVGSFPGGSTAEPVARLRTKDFAVFAELLFFEEDWAVESRGDWLMHSLHDYGLFFVDLRPRSGR